MHVGQIDIDESTLRRLLSAQCPEWSSAEIQRVDGAGTVNAVFRIGDAHAARLPLVASDPGAVRRAFQREAAAADEFNDCTSFAAPRTVTIGAPDERYPMPWSIQTWLPGATALDQDPARSLEFANDLATLITELRAIDVGEREFDGDGRGGSLVEHDEWMETCFAESKGLLDVEAARRAWRVFRELPHHSGDVVCHGDLIPSNVLVDGGRLAGVLDFGAYGAADPSLDLVAAWHMLERNARAHLRARLGSGDVEWERGKAWAFQQAMGLAWYYRESLPAMSRFGLRTLERIMAPDA